MNRYDRQGVAWDIDCGTEVLILVPPYIAPQVFVAQITELLEDDQYRVSSDLGYTAVTHTSGGLLRVMSIDNDLKGLKPDTVLCPRGHGQAARYLLNRGAELIEY